MKEVRPIFFFRFTAFSMRWDWSQNLNRHVNKNFQSADVSQDSRITTKKKELTKPKETVTVKHDMFPAFIWFIFQSADSFFFSS